MEYAFNRAVIVFDAYSSDARIFISSALEPSSALRYLILYSLKEDKSIFDIVN